MYHFKYKMDINKDGSNKLGGSNRMDNLGKLVKSSFLSGTNKLDEYEEPGGSDTLGIEGFDI